MKAFVKSEFESLANTMNNILLFFINSKYKETNQRVLIKSVYTILTSVMIPNHITFAEFSYTRILAISSHYFKKLFNVCGISGYCLIKGIVIESLTNSFTDTTIAYNDLCNIHRFSLNFPNGADFNMELINSCDTILTDLKSIYKIFHQRYTIIFNETNKTDIIEYAKIATVDMLDKIIASLRGDKIALWIYFVSVAKMFDSNIDIHYFDTFSNEVINKKYLEFVDKECKKWHKIILKHISEIL